MNKILLQLLISVVALVSAPVHAHGDGKPEYGGIMQMVDDLSFELVVKGNVADLYLGDHGEKVPSAGKTGKLTILSGGTKTEARLEPAGGHKLQAKDVKIVKGDKVIALVTSADNKTTSIRFVIK